MNGERCRLNGGGLGGGPGGTGGRHTALITLEDLEALTDEEFDSDPALSASSSQADGEGNDEEEEEAMEDQGDQEQQLLNYWRDIGREHRVDIPRDMAEPIQCLTEEQDSKQDRQRVPYTLLKIHDQTEQRRYEKASWACVCMKEDTYEQSICGGFMKIMRYICRQNSTGSYLGMTVPIVTVVGVDTSHSQLARHLTLAYYIPHEYQQQPPAPFDPDITIETWPPAVVYSREFSGSTNEESILHEIGSLSSALEGAGVSQAHSGDSFIVAGYTSVAAPQRLNEIWFVDRGET